MATCVLLNSGGKDSLAAAMVLGQMGHELYSLHVDIGLSTADHLANAERIARHHCSLGHEVFTGRFSSDPNMESPKGGGFYAQRVVLPTIGFSVALRIGAELVSSGHTWPTLNGKEDLADTLARYVMHTNRPENDGGGRPAPQFFFPLYGLQPHQIYDIVKRDPTWKTLSFCTQSPPCGKCHKCSLRAKFIAVGLARSKGRS